MENPLAWGPRPREKNTKASLAMWFGLGSILCTCAWPVALVLGILAKKEIRAEPGRYGNSGEATVGIVVGLIGAGLFAMAALAFIVAPPKPAPLTPATTTGAPSPH
jgi:hypothetical protein